VESTKAKMKKETIINVLQQNTGFFYHLCFKIQHIAVAKAFIKMIKRNSSLAFRKE
jgi:hypothetical protein